MPNPKLQVTVAQFGEFGDVWAQFSDFWAMFGEFGEFWAQFGDFWAQFGEFGDVKVRHENNPELVNGYLVSVTYSIFRWQEHVTLGSESKILTSQEIYHRKRQEDAIEVKERNILYPYPAQRLFLRVARRLKNKKREIFLW